MRALRPQPLKRQRDAYAHYLEGLSLDEEETTRDRAEQAYRKAIDLDPRLATALTNPGNLRLLAGIRSAREGRVVSMEARPTATTGRSASMKYLAAVTVGVWGGTPAPPLGEIHRRRRAMSPLTGFQAHRPVATR